LIWNHSSSSLFFVIYVNKCYAHIFKLLFFYFCHLSAALLVCSSFCVRFFCCPVLVLIQRHKYYSSSKGFMVVIITVNFLSTSQIYSMWHNRSSQRSYIVDFLSKYIRISFFLKLDVIKDCESQIIIDLWSYVEGYSMIVKI
jgi:hypothetical protein